MCAIISTEASINAILLFGRAGIEGTGQNKDGGSKGSLAVGGGIVPLLTDRTQVLLNRVDPA